MLNINNYINQLSNSENGIYIYLKDNRKTIITLKLKDLKL